MLKPFKKYTATVQWVNEDTKKVYSFIKVFNLYEIETYGDCNNELDGFNDKVKRTILSLQNNTSFIIHVPFEYFDEIYTEMMLENNLMDVSLDKKKENLIPFEAKWSYSGPIKYDFTRKESYITCKVFPKNYNSVSKSDIDIMSNSIDNNIIHFS